MEKRQNYFKYINPQGMVLIRLEGKLMAIEFERCQQWNDKNGKEYFDVKCGAKEALI